MANICEVYWDGGLWNIIERLTLLSTECLKTKKQHFTYLYANKFIV